MHACTHSWGDERRRLCRSFLALDQCGPLRAARKNSALRTTKGGTTFETQRPTATVFVTFDTKTSPLCVASKITLEGIEVQAFK